MEMAWGCVTNPRLQRDTEHCSCGTSTKKSCKTISGKKIKQSTSSSFPQSLPYNLHSSLRYQASRCSWENRGFSESISSRVCSIAAAAIISTWRPWLWEPPHSRERGTVSALRRGILGIAIKAIWLQTPPPPETSQRSVMSSQVARG